MMEKVRRDKSPFLTPYDILLRQEYDARHAFESNSGIKQSFMNCNLNLAMKIQPTT